MYKNVGTLLKHIYSNYVYKKRLKLRSFLVNNINIIRTNNKNDWFILPVIFIIYI